MNDRIKASFITLGTALLLVALLLLVHLRPFVPSPPPPPRPVAEMIPVEPEWVDFLDASYGPSDPAPAQAPEPRHAESRPAPASGHNTVDAGEQAAPAPIVTTPEPSPVKETPKPAPPQTGPDKAELEREEARRRAREAMGDAFRNTSDKPDNTADHGKQTGDSGTPDGGRSDANGTGTGTVGGGWTLPKYASVPSELTGSIVLTAEVDRDGNVVRVELAGGKAPAAANTALVRACIAEVKSKRLTRSDNNAPPTATARITYTFR